MGEGTLKLKLGEGGFRPTEAVHAYRGRKIEVSDSDHASVRGRNNGVGSNMGLYCVKKTELHFDGMSAFTVLNPRPKDYTLAKGRTLDD